MKQNIVDGNEIKEAKSKENKKHSTIFNSVCFFSFLASISRSRRVSILFCSVAYLSHFICWMIWFCLVLTVRIPIIFRFSSLHERSRIQPKTQQFNDYFFSLPFLIHSNCDVFWSLSIQQ